MSTTLKIAIVVAIATGLMIGMQKTTSARVTTFGCVKSPACLYNTNKPTPSVDEANKNQG